MKHRLTPVHIDSAFPSPSVFSFHIIFCLCLFHHPLSSFSLHFFFPLCHPSVPDHLLSGNNFPHFHHLQFAPHVTITRRGGCCRIWHLSKKEHLHVIVIGRSNIQVTDSCFETLFRNLFTTPTDFTMTRFKSD